MRYCIGLIVIIVVLLGAAPVYAHAGLVKSDPRPGSTLETAPREIVLQFSEDLDPAFTRVRLFDSTNQLVTQDIGAIDPQNPRVWRLTPGELPKGSYSAIWRARSATDGHITEGSVPFGVGIAVASAALIPPPGTPEPATAAPPIGGAVIRWLSLLAATLMLGGLPFALLIWRPAYRQATPALHHADTTMTTSIRRLILGGGGLLIVASLLSLIEQAVLAADVPLAQVFGMPLVQFLGSYSGLLIVARIGLALAVMALTLRLPSPGTGARWPWLTAMGMGAALLLTFSLGSHGAAEGSALAIMLDWLHIAATIVWIGGLVPLASTIWRARRGKDQTLSLGVLIPRFSTLALVCVALLGGSGLYSYFQHVGNPRLILDTTYGRALALKLALFVLLISFGAWNLLVLSPGLRKTNTSLARSFWRSIAAELAIGMLVLAAVGAMTSVAPSKTAWAEQEKLGEIRYTSAPGVDLRIQVAPAQIGDNEFAVDVHDKRAGAAPPEVLLRFSMQGMEMGQVETTLPASDNGRYLTRGNYLSMGGRWNIEVILRREGMADVRQTFAMDIVKAAQP